MNLLHLFFLEIWFLVIEIRLGINKMKQEGEDANG